MGIPRALIGKWVEEENGSSTPVSYSITIRDGRVFVRGLDESDGTRLRISGASWDGRKLRFVSFYPPTGHKAAHDFQLVSKRRAKHWVRYRDEDGRFSMIESWKRV